MRRILIVLGLAAIVGAGVAVAVYRPFRMLELDVANESGAPVVIEVLGADDAAASLHEAVGPESERELWVGRPDAWVVAVNGRVVTDSTLWFHGATSIELVVRIGPDGSASVTSGSFESDL